MAMAVQCMLILLGATAVGGAQVIVVDDTHVGAPEVGDATVLVGSLADAADTLVRGSCAACTIVVACNRCVAPSLLSPTAFFPLAMGCGAARCCGPFTGRRSFSCIHHSASHGTSSVWANACS
jgi:hypothetical protein